MVFQKHPPASAPSNVPTAPPIITPKAAPAFAPPTTPGLLSHASTRVFIVNNNIFYYIKIT
jgi:hypothetical protein